MFAQQLAVGKAGESKIANWLRRKGYHVLPVYEKEISEGKGPQLFTALGPGLVAPDLLAFNGDKVRWIEAKHKSVFSWYRIGQRWVTGIDLRHYNDYLKVCELSPWPVWLLFLHSQSKTTEHTGVCPTGLFGESLSILAGKESHRSLRHGKSGMVYWARDDLKLLASLDEVNAASVISVPTPMAQVGMAV